jgi:pyrrolidone-carboxylate peptidase
MLRILCMLSVLAALTAAEPAADVLITAYKPFAGRKVNGSETMAGWLGRELGPRVRIEVMECTWGQPEALVERVVKGKTWKAIIGLGEGWPGLINVEQVARNARAGADEAKAPPAEDVIAPGGVDLRRGLRLDSAWFKELPAPGPENAPLGGLAGVVLSSNAGTYLCNNAFYRYAQQTAVPVVGFIHVPIQGDLADADFIKRYGPTLRIIIEKNLPGAR